MKVHLFSVGKPALPYARTGTEDYLKRLRRFGGITWEPVKREADLFTRSDGMLRVLLDERGELLSTADWSKRMADWEEQPVKRLAFVIGPAEGFTDASRQQADALLSLSRLTLNHELALLVLCEQIYRVACLRSGHPYHRA